ncbi:hypothetical protein TD95_002550 [Thielaviopsis punctulata]|uniref:G domain-containing protein n=1 Tax=Thielaviopsis punctulata TaxID=72032 RepID=A0A0F4ZCY8_9PEZI|nr:hypothetical protein TD95_002550 [Thielaviopsis punctulata]
MDTVNIAVIGASGVGKSTYIQRILGLSRLPLSDASTLSYVVDNVTHSVTLIEMDLENLDFASGGGSSSSSQQVPIQWPRQINGHFMPQVDGAMIMYDVTNADSIRDLDKTLNALTNSGLPAVLVACKCDRPQNCREINAEGIANHDRFRACIDNFTLSSNKPEHARVCLTTILRAAIKMRRG